MDMMFLGFGLRDRGGRVYARVEGVSTNGNSWIESFRVKILEVNGIIRPGHRIRHFLSSQPKRPGFQVEGAVTE